MTDDANFFSHEDSLAGLNASGPLQEKLHFLHQTLKRRYVFIVRLAVAVYDPKTGLLKTFMDSSGDTQPLHHYQARLHETESLREILSTGRPRVINDLSVLTNSDKAHSRRILDEGYQASYTLPMYQEGRFFGFIFFDSSRSGVFDGELLDCLDLFGHLLSLLVLDQVRGIDHLQAAVRTARDITHHRDSETGGHLDRMARYARLIAEQLAPKYGFSDEFVENVFMFSPLHDIGKISIPDQILLKPGRLDQKEFEIMKTHARRGREIIDDMLQHFGLDELDHGEVLRNIAQYHHEALNGQGYPDGLRGEEIPIEARIIAVADIFDALTSDRPYKKAWRNEDAFTLLRKMAGNRLDGDCVDALLQNRGQIEEIQGYFREDRSD